MSRTQLGGCAGEGRRQREAHCSKVSVWFGEGSDLDVLEEDGEGLANANDVCDGWPEVSWVAFALSSPRLGEGLAREPCSDKVQALSRQ